MKRVVTGFILSLIVFLCAGYTQVYASSLKESVLFTPDRFVKASLPGTDKVHHAIDATVVEQEDDTQSSSKKFVDNSTVTTLTYSSRATVQRWPSGQSCANTPCSRSYISLRVFRI